MVVKKIYGFLVNNWEEIKGVTKKVGDNNGDSCF